MHDFTSCTMTALKEEQTATAALRPAAAETTMLAATKTLTTADVGGLLSPTMVKMTPSNLDAEQMNDDEYLASSGKTQKFTNNDDDKSISLIQSKEIRDEENSNKSKSANARSMMSAEIFMTYRKMLSFLFF